MLVVIRAGSRQWLPGGDSGHGNLKGESFIFEAYRNVQIIFRQMSFHYCPKQPRHEGEMSEHDLMVSKKWLQA